MAKKILLFILVFLFSSVLICQAEGSEPPKITAKAAIVMEALTGKILFEKNAYEQKYPASTTKIMTLITALEHSNLDDIVTTSDNAASTEGSSLWLSPKEQLSMRDMLYGIMLISGNDATVAVAEHVSGSVDNFAKLMTEKAISIGAKNTNFVNSNGLPDPKHYTTAYDLALITAYGYKNPTFTEIVSTEHRIIPWQGKNYDRDLYNENKMLYNYEGANGVKTGYTDLAGRCLVSAAKRSDMQLIAVVLDSEALWEDSAALLDYGFSQLKPIALIRQGDVLKTVNVREGEKETVRLLASKDLIVPVADGERDQFKIVISAPSEVKESISAGQTLGYAKVFYQDKEIKTVKLCAEETVKIRSFFKLIVGSLWNFFTLFIKYFA